MVRKERKMERRVIIDTKPKENKDNIVFIQYTGKNSLCDLVKVAQRMAPDKIIINDSLSYPPYELNTAKRYIKSMIQNDVYKESFYIFR